MESIVRDIAILSGSYGDLYKVTLRNLRAELDAQKVLEPTWTDSDLIDWAIEKTGVPEEDLTNEYITAISDVVDSALAL